MIANAPVNVCDYGAKGDGVTNDASAIQAAINAANGRPVYIPAGTYVIQSTITSYNTSGQKSKGIRIYGEGPENTIILNKVTSGYCFDFNHSIGSTTYANQVYSLNSYVRDLSVQGSAAILSSSAFKLRGLWGFQLINCYVTKHTLYGVHIDVDSAYNPDITSCVRMLISECYITYNKIGIYSPQTQAMPTAKINNTAIDYNTDIGILSSSNYLSVESGSISFNGSAYSGDFTPSLSYGGFIHPNVSTTLPCGNRLTNTELDGNQPQQVFSAVSSNMRISECRFGIRLVGAETNKYMVVFGVDAPAGVFGCTDPVVEHCAININAGNYASVTTILFKFNIGSRYGYIGNNTYFITGTGLTAATNLFFISEDPRTGSNAGAPNGVQYQIQNVVTNPFAYDVQFRSGFVYQTPNNTVVSFRPSFNGGVMLLSGGSAFASGVIGYVGNPGSVWQIATAAAGVVLTTGVLTGTTGTVGRLNISAYAGVIYVENRVGSTLPISIKVLPDLSLSV